MAQALWIALRELRMAGVKSRDLERKAFESPEKHAELEALLDSYEKFLADNARGDMATVYEEAVLHRDWCPIQDADCWTELPDTFWNPLQRRLMDTLPGVRIPPRALEIPSATLPRRLAGRSVQRMSASPAETPLAFFLAPGSVSTEHPAPSTARPALSTKHRALSTKHPALSTQHPALSTQHRVFSNCFTLFGSGSDGGRRG